MNYFYLFTALLVSYLGTFIVRRFASRKNIIDVPNARSSHKVPTPRGGGLAIFISWYLVLLLLQLENEIPDKLFFSLLCGVPIALIGFFDDIVSISPKLRFSVQLVCASMAVVLLGGLNEINFGYGLVWGGFVFSLVGLVGIIWFTNLFNFLDGIDGYLSVETIFICCAIFLLLGFEIPVFLAAATAGFLVWNWQPAKIFMGDVGSTLIGFTIGILAVYYQNTDQSSIFIWLMLSSLFWFDATLTLFRRWRNNEKLSEAHKKHAYQRIVQSGFTHQKTVLFSIIINFPILILAWLAQTNPNLTLYLFGINLVYLYFIMRQVDSRFPFAK